MERVRFSIEGFNDSAKRFPKTSYSFGWLLETVAANDGTFRRRVSRTSVASMEVADIGEGNGYLSKVFKVTIHFADESDQLIIVLKVPYTTALHDAIVSAVGHHAELASFNDDYFHARSVHNRECKFYEKFRSQQIVPLPKIYAIEKFVPGHSQGAIVMEYLGQFGTTIALHESLNMYQIRNIVKLVAHMHARSLTMNEADLAEYEFPRDVVDGTIDLVRKGAQLSSQMKPQYFEHAYNRMKHLMEKPDFIIYTMTALNKDLGLKAVIANGDLWANNIFWKKNTDGSHGNDVYAIIDWQLMHAGAVGIDLAMCIGICADAHVRREAEKSIFEFYIANLENGLLESGTKIPFTAEQVRACYRRAFVFTAIQMFTFLPFLLSSGSQPSPNFEDVYEARNELMFLRVKMALEDSLRILEDDMPQWLDPSYTYSGLKL
ncbi:putative oxidoreductase dhs-27 [Toxocara canis]|uniref:Putative oxidoreductase dhs-27 n=1 Tax=Toxocara canis TaxID=6265 RepID=A0A0B2VH46_TOXCA|nr:putative oxidoreductase dhs-27 [Toxocara canis]